MPSQLYAGASSGISYTHSANIASIPQIARETLRRKASTTEPVAVLLGVLDDRKRWRVATITRPIETAYATASYLVTVAQLILPMQKKYKKEKDERRRRRTKNEFRK